ncbi:MAG: hypothetical protein HY056_07615 [Proteobacteria bacterium]|nr:hypothetical protein [Pseudomonadota bacterium]
MLVRIAIACWGLALGIPALTVAALASDLKPEEARRFVAGKLFAYNCFEGTTGMGRINADGSVAGTIRMRGANAARYIVLPANTVRVQPESICASVRGVPFQPCFNIVKTSNSTFRGSVSGFGFAYCDFTRVNPRLRMAGGKARERAVKPVELADGAAE